MNIWSLIVLGTGTAQSDQVWFDIAQVEMGRGHDCSPQNKLLLEVRTTLEMVEESLQKRYKDISKFLQSEHWSNSQVTNAALLTDQLTEQVSINSQYLLGFPRFPGDTHMKDAYNM